MSRWGAALAGAVGAVANVGAQSIDRDMKLADQMAAEQRAADMKLSLAERTLAMEEAMRKRAAERFAAVTKGKLAEPVPLEAQTVEQTGITRESAAAALGTRDYGNGPEAATGIAASAEEVKEYIRQAKATLANPSATPEQREAAQMLIEQLDQQAKAQGDLNAEAVKGKTRTRTVSEARDAALEETALNGDVVAHEAGRSLWKDAMASERLDAKEKVEANEKQAQRESQEKIAGMRVEQQAAETERKANADQLRYQAVQDRIEAISGGKGGRATALMQNVAFLEERGYSKQQIEKFIFNAKDSTELEKAFKLLQADNFGEMTPMQALAKVQELSSAAGTGDAGGEKIRTWNPTTRKFE